MNGKIALEEHFALEDTLEDAIYSRNFPAWSDMRRRLVDLHDLRLPEMDKYGIELMIMSLHNPAVQGIPEPAKAVAMARRVNDTLAAAVAKRPDRFAGFATLPMQDPDAAIVELTRCIKDLGFKGAMVNGFSQVGTPDKVVYLDDLRYRPFWAKVEELNVPLYLHPRDPLPNREPIYEGHFWFMGSAWAFGVETAMHALRLMGSGLFDHYPKLNIILGHLGEGIPYSVWRLDHRISRTPRNIPAKRKMAEYLESNFYLTVSGDFRTPTLIDAMLEVGADRILFSVDYPFETVEEACTWFDALHISERDKQKIGRLNSAALFNLKGTTATKGA
jgi:predicted TIM-barrel fold metal-dependent hydrolase